MTLPLTPHMLASCYEFLRTTPPYRGWRMPHADQVEFLVTRAKQYVGQHQATEPHRVFASSHWIGHTDTLVFYMGHEMIHVAQAVLKLETPNAVHNADFRRKAALACRYHGWDLRQFV